MAIELFDAELVIARLTAEVSTLKQIGGSADFNAAIQGGPLTPPAAFVIPLAERPSDNELATTAVSQRDNVSCGVVFAVRNLRDALGREAHVELRALRIAVMTALLGWTPDSDVYDVFTFAPSGGRLLQFADQVLWWQDDFSTALYLRSI